MDSDNKLNTKTEFREYAKHLRDDLDIVKISKEICENFQKQNFFKYSENILSFYPFNNEINLTELYKDSSKNWYLPRIEYPRSLVIHKYTYGDTLVKNKWGVSEPCCDLEEIDLHKIDIAIIPALMADKSGTRLGYGAGFYDRFIPGLRKDCLKIVPVPEELFVEALPADNWDIPVDKIITQSNIYKSSSL